MKKFIFILIVFGFREVALAAGATPTVFLGVKPAALWDKTHRIATGIGLNENWEGTVDLAFQDKRNFDGELRTQSQAAYAVFGKNGYWIDTTTGFFNGIWLGFGHLQTRFEANGIARRVQGSLVSLGLRTGYKFKLGPNEFLSIGVSPGAWISRQETKLGSTTRKYVYRPYFSPGFDDLIYCGISF